MCPDWNYNISSFVSYQVSSKKGLKGKSQELHLIFTFIALSSFHFSIKPPEARTSQWDESSLFFQAYPAKWKDTVIWVQLLWFENSNKLCKVGFCFTLLRGNPCVESLMMCKSCRPVWFVCYTVPPCSPRTHSHIAGIMKLMFHRPLLGHDKMDEKEEKRWEEQEIRPDGEEGEKTTLFSGLCAFLFFFCSWQKGSIEDKASVCWFWFIVLIFCESCPYKLQRC